MKLPLLTSSNPPRPPAGGLPGAWPAGQLPGGGAARQDVPEVRGRCCGEGQRLVCWEAFKLLAVPCFQPATHWLCDCHSSGVEARQASNLPFCDTLPTSPRPTVTANSDLSFHRSGGARAGHAFDFSLLLMPRRSAVAEQLLEEQGILGDVAIRCVGAVWCGQVVRSCCIGRQTCAIIVGPHAAFARWAANSAAGTFQMGSRRRQTALPKRFAQPSHPQAVLPKQMVLQGSAAGLGASR